jgi:hypothetical protein
MGAPVGNKNAAKSRVVEQMIRKLCVQEDWARLHTALDQQLTKAAEGDRAALEFVRDTLDGKPGQSIDANVSGSLGLIDLLRTRDAGSPKEQSE